MSFLDKAKEWIRTDKDESTRQQLQSWIDSNDKESLSKAFSKRIEFGTAGLRAKMSAGPAYMNHVTVQQAAQGLCRYLEWHFPESLDRGVVIGYDARHRSQSFAELSSAVMLSAGIQVYMYDSPGPTPLVPFTVQRIGAIAGIMVTASHNPKEDNGYKVYWANGAQIVNPHDRGIHESILSNLTLWKVDGPPYSWVRERVTLLGSEMYEYYFQETLRFQKRTNNSAAKTVVYTPLHGVGGATVRKIWQRWGFPELCVVEQQFEPDPEFPTTKFPNPEEGKGTLALAMAKAQEVGAHLILANDPDADRLGVVELQADGTWHIFTGDEIAALLLDWLMEFYVSVQKKAVVASTVSSKMTKKIIEDNGGRFEEVLTGFKWIVNKVLELEKEGFSIVLAYEEAIGFSIGNLVRDKDGMLAAAIFNELYQEKCSSIRLKEHLENLRAKYGYFVTKNKYFFCYDSQVIAQIFQDIRASYPTSIGGYPVKYVRDLTDGYDNSQPNNKPILPVSTSTQMITFTFENGAIVTLRTSGTEPKIKYYTDYCGTSKEQAEMVLNGVVDSVIQECLKPEEYNLGFPSD